MDLLIRSYTEADLEPMIDIWNQIVEEGRAFPQTDSLNLVSGREFFSLQDYCGVAVADEKVTGLYILHPNNIGRCGHIGNCSYAVARDLRGQHIGESLVKDSINQALKHGFRLLQFNAVVSTNYPALHIYDKLGFERLGTIPEGFLMKDGHYEDIVLFYYDLCR